jgi:protein TonB
MIEKKSAKGNIDNKRGSYLLIGLVIILSLVYAGFELFATQDQAKDMSIQDEEAVEVFDEQTKNVEQPETAPPPQEQIREQVIEVVDNDVLVKDDFDFSVDFTENEAVSDYTMVEVIQEETEKEPPLRFVEDMPQFPGGAEAWVAYLQKELKYPESCRILNLSGVVVVEFIVEKDGKISNVKAITQVYPDLDDEAKRVISASPKWIPGKQMGKPVRVTYTIPIRFTLN